MLTPLALQGDAWGGVAIITVVAVVIGIAALVSVLKNPQFSGGTKAMWVAAILLFPILGSFVYFGVRNDW